MVFGMAKHGENRNKYLAAEMLLKGSGLNMLDAASLAVELLSLCGGAAACAGPERQFSWERRN